VTEQQTAALAPTHSSEQLPRIDVHDRRGGLHDAELRVDDGRRKHHRDECEKQALP
jgi:hypothetical protein